MLKLVSILLIAALCVPGAAVGLFAPESAGGSADAAHAALAAALEAAGLKEAAVSDVRTEYDVDDSRSEYEVEFRDGDWEYEYSVDAETGAILEADRDYEPPRVFAPEAPAPEVNAPKRLSAQEAKDIALAEAGLSADAVSRLKAEFDIDDGIAQWEVEFRSGGWEYEYEINADSGAVISWEKDRD
jgi:uncharacterized membrane protein YkoI